MNPFKITLTFATALVFLLVVAGSAAAQEPVVVRAWPTIQDPSNGGIVEMEPDGRMDFPTTVHLQVDGQFYCATATDITVQVLPPPQFPGWAGMSMVPQPALYTFTVQGAGPADEDTQTGPTFNTAWDMDTAPTNQTVEYVVGVEIVDIGGANDQPEACLPLISSGNQQAGSAMLNVSRPWAPPVEGEEVDCTVEPEHPQCIEEANRPSEGGDSPGFGVVVLIGALAAAAFVSRRRRQ
jgi:PGF-CTERM protein